MKTALLIGNGPNRCYEDRNSPISWSNLLQKFAEDNGVEFNPNSSFPLEFECLVNDICKHNKVKSSEDVVYDAKKTVIQTIDSLTLDQDPIHRRFLELGIDEIMTTNYDYYLEKALDSNVKIPKGRGQTRYSLKRHITVNGKRFHHIHGEAKYSRTLCLGYEHYSATIQQMRNYVKKHKFRQILAPKKPSSTTSTLSGNSWIDLMFTHDVHIVGLKLEACEIDLWWLLSYRAFLHYLNDQGRKNITNTITFHDTTPRSDKELKYYKSLFERMDVTYKSEKVERNDEGILDFKGAFTRIAKEIKDSMKP